MSNNLKDITRIKNLISWINKTFHKEYQLNYASEGKNTNKTPSCFNNKRGGKKKSYQKRKKEDRTNIEKTAYSLMNNPNNYKIFLCLLIIMNLLLQVLTGNNQTRILDEYRFPNITLKINGTGIKNILSDHKEFKTNDYPDMVYINGEIQSTVNYSYFFNLTENNVELIWNNYITQTLYMFHRCSDIIEIDLSNFNTSFVTDMKYMFAYCYSLASINLTNFNTSSAIYINSMFRDCSSLTSLDLSYFDTSKVSWMDHLVYNCKSLTSINITHFNTSKTTDMEFLVSGCPLLTSIDLSKFDTSITRQMHGMFSNCIGLTSLDLSNFDTSQVKYMYKMFSNCITLKSLNLSNFYTPNLENMYNMFSNCSALTSLDLSNFNTSKITDMKNIFSGCRALTSLNLLSFDTSQVRNMNSMFYECSSLSSLDLSNFDTSKVQIMNNMFDGCIYLEYLNLKNFSEKSLKLNNFKDIFNKLPDNIVACLNNDTNYLLSELNKTKCYRIGCFEDWIWIQKKIDIETDICLNNCGDKYEYNGKCFNKCKNRYYLDNYNISRCKCELEKCFSCPNVALANDLCVECNTDYYPMENGPSNLGKYINCYKEIKGYYLDRNDSLFKKCYHTCDTCDTNGDYINHKCIKCKSNYSVEINQNEYYNCYQKCEFYYYLDKENIYHCTNNSFCPDEYPKLIEDKMECIKYEIKDILQNIIINATQMGKEEEMKYYDNILTTIELGFTSEYYDTSKIDKGEEEVIKTEKMNITLTTTQNQKKI